MDIDLAAKLILNMVRTKEQAILDTFAKPNGMVIGDGDYRSVFVPGSRRDRVLLVAHVDTVWNDTHLIDAKREGNLIVSANRARGLSKKGSPINIGCGTGVDDRAGIAMLMALKDLGHSMLITTAEECGALGAINIMSHDKMAYIINNHNFVIEFDRNGFEDLVFYDVGTPEFIKYCERSTGYRQKSGSFTDICVLCEKACGVNISVGFKNEHTCNETLNLRWWLRTYNVCAKWLEQDGLPSFKRD